jgi:glycosyltransferase involved in cell wall biosynthesis
MSKLLIITQKVDEVDDLLGFFVSWIREFSTHVERVTVITLGKGAYTLPHNIQVLSLGKEVGVSKIKQAIRLFQFLWREVRTHDAVFAHMSPVFALAAAPFTMAWNKKLVLWYLHRSITLRLRLAEKLVDTIVTADRQSLTLQSPKIVEVGHGIDVARFTVTDRASLAGRPLRILSVGRLSPIKGFDTLIRAIQELQHRNIQIEVRIVGRAVMSDDTRYERELRELVAQLGIGDILQFVGFVPYVEIPAQYRWADVVVGCTPPGGIDKAILEGMASSCAVVTSNSVMKKYFTQEHAGEYVFDHGGAKDLARKLERLVRQDLPGIGQQMHRIVVDDHNLSVTVRKILTFL